MKYINSQQYDTLKKKIMKKYQNSDNYIKKLIFHEISHEKLANLNQFLQDNYTQ